jgi:hypothetical protein
MLLVEKLKGKLNFVDILKSENNIKMDRKYGVCWIQLDKDKAQGGFL